MVSYIFPLVPPTCSLALHWYLWRVHVHPAAVGAYHSLCPFLEQKTGKEHLILKALPGKVV